MKKRFFLLAILAIAGFSVLRLKKNPVPSSPVGPQELLEVLSSTSRTPSAKKGIPSNPSAFKEVFQHEVQLSARLDEHPEESERRLDLIASKLTPDDQKFLKEIVLDQKTEGDQRAVAEEILGRSPSPSTPSLLEEIAARELGNWPEPQQSDFERALSARAIEHLGTHPSKAAENSLKKLTRTLSDSFLIDRAQRALLARSGKVPPPEEQDKEAFRKILTPSGPHPHH